MPSKRLTRTGLAAVAAAVVVNGVPAHAELASGVQSDAAAAKTQSAQAQPVEAHGITAEELEAAGSALMEPPPGGWPVPSRRSYYLTGSCQASASVIAAGAAAWQGLTQGGGTPVECRNSYITDCGGGGRIVGCNWGRGQRIALFLGGVRDQRLLAAHEFGHDWYGHSSYRCAGWGSASEVMAPSLCGGKLGKTPLIPID
ncbi:hypothetical protein E1264_01910 [Actinomadura sp. KC216]|uniref:hypothetical protein n=1 Tax=Actinomadura sp. KC216 TaxID=2530370 RepID=UPI00104EF696|nr:hypothetical protein [Actinomadura sp. KC216]TDB91408.1 hypothetical protein E1264_01910 [Actinomadura sp. KC216]